MALSGRVIFSSYPYAGYGNQSPTQGRAESLPSALTYFEGVPAGTTAGNNIIMASCVCLLPSGLNQKPTKFYTPSTPAELQTNGN